MYSTMLGIKLINLYENKLVRLLGKVASSHAAAVEGVLYPCAAHP